MVTNRYFIYPRNSRRYTKRYAMISALIIDIFNSLITSIIAFQMIDDIITYRKSKTTKIVCNIIKN